MRTETINILSFNELSENAKETAREWYSINSEYPWFKECKESLGAFCDHFGVAIKDYCFSDDYRAFIETDAENNHFRGVKLKNINPDYMPTGFFTDCDLWQTFYTVFKTSGGAKYAFNQALEQFIKTVRQDIEYQFSNEAIDETLTINEYEFTEDGKIY